MGNKIKHLLEGFKYQEIATIYCILKYINEKDLEIYIEKQNEEDAQIILDKNHIIDLQFKNKIGKQITIEEFCKWLSNFEGNKLDIHLLKKLVEHSNKDNKNKIEIIVGAGLNILNIGEIKNFTDANNFHFSGKKVRKSGMEYKKQDINMGIKGFSEFEILETDEKIVQEVSEYLKKTINQ